MLLQMHRNLGHPLNERLAKALQSSGQRPELVQGALDIRCAVCSACSPPKHQRPGTLRPMADFNFKIYLDGITWTNQQGKSFHFYHILDAGTNYHAATIAPSHTTSDVIQILDQHRVSWAGSSHEIQVNAGTDLNSEELNEFMIVHANHVHKTHHHMP